MRHRLDLRVQDGMIDQSRHAGAGRGNDQRLRKRHFMRTDVRAYVIDRLRSPCRLRERMRIVHLAGDDLANAHGFQGRLMRRASDQGAHRRAACDERLDKPPAGLAARTGDEDHAWLRESCTFVAFIHRDARKCALPRVNAIAFIPGMRSQTLMVRSAERASRTMRPYAAQGGRPFNSARFA